MVGNIVFLKVLDVKHYCVFFFLQVIITTEYFISMNCSITHSVCIKFGNEAEKSNKIVPFGSSIKWIQKIYKRTNHVHSKI